MRFFESSEKGRVVCSHIWRDKGIESAPGMRARYGSNSFNVNKEQTTYFQLSPSFPLRGKGLGVKLPVECQLELKVATRGGGGELIMTPLCKSFFKNTTYNIQMRWRTLVSNCVTPLPPLENPGYTPEGVIGPLLSPPPPYSSSTEI